MRLSGYSASMTNLAAKTTEHDLLHRLQQTDPRVLLIPARVLQRVVRFDRRLSTLDLSVPHADCYFISRERLVDFTTRYEYQLQLDRDLPTTLILLPLPEEDELNEAALGKLLRRYWRLLFHVRVHLEYRELSNLHKLDADRLLERLCGLGPIPFAEARQVLQREEMLLPPTGYLSMYTEFAATFLELWYFARQELSAYFPAVSEPSKIAQMLSADFDHLGLYKATRPDGSPDAAEALSDDLAVPPAHLVRATNAADASETSNLNLYRRCVARSIRMDAIGHYAKAAVVRQRAVRVAPVAQQSEAATGARDSIVRFAERLADVLELPSEQVIDLADALQPLVAQSDRGFRSIESKLLYDLQKACAEHDRGVYAVDLWRWTAGLGKSALRRPLPLLRSVLVTRHLKSALHKLPFARLDVNESQRLSRIFAECAARARQLLREQVRPLIQNVFESEGCQPRTVVEVTAFKKVVEELLDRVVDNGHLSMGHLRDSISQSNLKLPDLVQVGELLTGDQLLRIDRRLATVLDGVYHRGPIYLRMSHRISSLAFGTPFGRVLTRYVALPFGGAYLILETYLHLVHFLFPNSPEVVADTNLSRTSTTDPTTAPQTIYEELPSVTAISFVLIFGIFLMLLIENEAFRGWCFRGLRRLGSLVTYLVRDVPALLFRLAWVRRILESTGYVAFLNYVFKPLLISTGILLLVHRVLHWLPDRNIVSQVQLESVPKLFPAMTFEIWWIILFLAANVFHNSPFGRYTDALVMDNVRRGWRELRIKVFAAVFRFIIDSFQWMLKTFEQVIYTVDELLRFRSGENWLTLVAKAVLGLFWSVISYVVRIYITLLIEPQINPIKHFPVVTVSHKMILPFSLSLTNFLATPLERIGVTPFWANSIAGPTVFLLPGVFGFLAWELKENWRLYAANRRRSLGSIPVGEHGETMVRLLRPGFHSGTIPKLFTKLRRAWYKAENTGNHNAVRKIDERLHHVEHSIKIFVEREWIALLQELPDWRQVPLRVDVVRLATNEIVVDIVRDDGPREPLRLIIADLGGWLLARVTAVGWSEHLPAGQKESMFAAFQGAFRYCGIDLVWHDLIKGLGLSVEPIWYDFNRDGALIWTNRQFDSNVQYKLRDMGATLTLSPHPKFVTEPRQEDLSTIVFSHSPITWESWVQSWEAFDKTPTTEL